jgi:hypothetical protein
MSKKKKIDNRSPLEKLGKHILLAIGFPCAVFSAFTNAFAIEKVMANFGIDLGELGLFLYVVLDIICIEYPIMVSVTILGAVFANVGLLYDPKMVGDFPKRLLGYLRKLSFGLTFGLSIFVCGLVYLSYNLSQIGGGEYLLKKNKLPNMVAEKMKIDDKAVAALAEIKAAHNTQKIEERILLTNKDIAFNLKELSYCRSVGKACTSVKEKLAQHRAKLKTFKESLKHHREMATKLSNQVIATQAEAKATLQSDYKSRQDRLIKDMGFKESAVNMFAVILVFLLILDGMLNNGGMVEKGFFIVSSHMETYYRQRETLSEIKKDSLRMEGINAAADVKALPKDAKAMSKEERKHCEAAIVSYAVKFIQTHRRKPDPVNKGDWGNLYIFGKTTMYKIFNNSPEIQSALDELSGVKPKTKTL